MMTKRVLFVDDQDFVRKANIRCFHPEFRAAGIKVDQAENGREALELVLSSPDDEWLIISDTQMPEMNGLSFFAALSWEHPHIHARKILISASEVDRGAIEACGADMFVGKNVDNFLERLRPQIKQFLQS